jgi:predicted metal-dependent phosphoesterase TrpH
MIDLHLHSRYSSDGERSPEELIRLCRESHITLASVADHNCIRANTEARAAAAAAGIACLPGIEIDCVFAGVNFHVLGYGIDLPGRGFAEIEQNVRDQGRGASLTMLAKTQALGFAVTEEELARLTKESYWPETWTGELFAEVLLQKPEYRQHPLLAPYRPGAPRGDNPYVNFYWDYYAQGKPCHAPVRYPAMEDILACIHKNHGAAVLAHPGVNLKGKEELLGAVLSLGMDGIEAFSSYHTPEQAKFYFEAAQARGLFVTCGSDYHGKTKPAIRPGIHGCLLSDAALQAQLPDCMKRYIL